MILVDREIERLATKQGMIAPFDSKMLNPASLDVRLGRTFTTVMRNKNYPYIEASRPETMHTVTYENDKILLKPGQFILGTLVEYIKLPRRICARLMGKSSLGRLGIDNSSVAGFIDNEFEGALVIELFNHSNNPILLKEGDRIGQLLFYGTDDPKVSYKEKATSKYRGQSPGQPSKGI